MQLLHVEDAWKRPTGNRGFVVALPFQRFVPRILGSARGYGSRPCPGIQFYVHQLNRSPMLEIAPKPLIDARSERLCSYHSYRYRCSSGGLLLSGEPCTLFP